MPNYSPVRIPTRQPPGGVLGQLPEFSRDALGLLTRCARDYGDFVRLRLGLMSVVVVNHPMLVEEVLVTRSDAFRKNAGMRRLRTALGNGLLVSEGDQWLRQRRLIQPAFHRRWVDSWTQTMVSLASRAIAPWRGGDVRDIYAELKDLTLEIAARTLFGTDIAENLNIDLMLEARDERTGQPMSDRQLRDEVLTMLSASYDTTPLALTWAFVLLSCNPLAERRLHCHLDTVLSGRLPTAADLNELNYLDWIVSETLRLYPSAWAGGMAQRLPRGAYLPFGAGQRTCIGGGFAQLEIVLELAIIAQRFHVEVQHPVEPQLVLTLQPRDAVRARLTAR